MKPAGRVASRGVSVAELGNPPLNADDEFVAVQFGHVGMALGDLVPVQAA
jgi:hypothetical protein